ncbi:MAG: hypothetical protein QG564_968 [Campylobacterota bacterium]|nr:hypothetical protein [Campylobacterota bacterium]
MVKKVTIAFLCMVLGATLNAREISTGDKFLGLEVGAATVQADTGGFFGELDHEGTDVELGFRLGVQNEAWRTTLIYDYFDSSDDDQNYEKGMLTLDYYFLEAAQGSQMFNPYIGLNVGYMNYESTGIDENGFLYGGQVGVTFNVMESIDVDLGYRYSLTDAAQTDHIGSVVLGINYLY